MSEVDLAGLRAAAEAANEPEFDWYDAASTEGVNTKNPEDIALIAAASPDVMLALVERVERAEARAWTFEGAIDALDEHVEHLKAKVARVEAEFNDLADELDEADRCHVWATLGGVTLGGAVRHTLREALNGPEAVRNAPVSDSDAGKVPAPSPFPSWVRESIAASLAKPSVLEALADRPAPSSGTVEYHVTNPTAAVGDEGDGGRG